MRSPGLFASAAWLVAGVLLAAPVHAARDESEMWVPALAFYSGVVGQKAEGSITSGPVLGPALPGANRAELRPPTSGDDLMMTPFTTASIEVMTPALVSGFGRPRVFVHGDAGPSFAFTRVLAREETPGAACTFADPIPAECATTALNPILRITPRESNILGQGSQLTAEVRPWLFSAGAGVAFTVPVGERRLRIKPSIEYMRQEVEVTGSVFRAVATGPTVAFPANPPLPTIPGFRGAVLTATTSEDFHGVGPGLEIEMDTRRAGPFLLALFISGQAYRFLGDGEIRMSASNEFGETADWTYQQNPWAYRGGVGMRFRFVPRLDAR
jgi:hypothetical protein